MSSCPLYNHDKVNASREISFLAQPITTCQSAVLLQNISYVSEFGPHIHGSSPFFSIFLKKKKKRGKRNHNWIKKIKKLLNSERTQWWILKAINDTDVHVERMWETQETNLSWILKLPLFQLPPEGSDWQPVDNGSTISRPHEWESFPMPYAAHV